MRERLLMFYSDNKPWFYLVTHVYIGILLTVFVMMVNLEILPILDYIPDFLLTKVNLAETILSTLAGAWLSVTTFTFSTTMVVLTTYSSNYSPRVVENFLQNKRTMKVLGTFIGGFIYCVSMLLLINESFVTDLVLSPVVAILYAFWCLIQFVLFIFSVANAIQPQNLISGLYEEAEAQIEAYIKRNEFKRTSDLDVADFSQKQELLATDSGQLTSIDSDKLLELLSDYAFKLVIQVQAGDFVRKGQVLAILYSDAKIELDEKIERAVNRQFHLKNKRFVVLDYRYAIEKIVDVAIRALSTGVGDPNTAISAIRSLGLLTGHLSQIEGIYDVLELEREDGPPSEILIENHNLKYDLFKMYSQIVEYGKSDVHVMKEVMDSLHGALLVSAPSNRAYLKEMAQYVYESTVPEYNAGMERSFMEEAKQMVDAM